MKDGGHTCEAWNARITDAGLAVIRDRLAVVTRDGIDRDRLEAAVVDAIVSDAEANPRERVYRHEIRSAWNRSGRPEFVTLDRGVHVEVTSGRCAECPEEVL